MIQVNGYFTVTQVLFGRDYSYLLSGIWVSFCWLALDLGVNVDRTPLPTEPGVWAASLLIPIPDVGGTADGFNFTDCPFLGSGGGLVDTLSLWSGKPMLFSDDVGDG